MRIFVKLHTWKTLALEAERSDTIDYVKGLIEEKEGFNRWDFKLFFCWNCLEDSKTLAHYNIQIESTIHTKPIIRESMHVYIKTFLGKIVMGVDTDDTINYVKAQIQERMSIPVNEQRLMFSGKALEDCGRNVYDYNIQNGSTLRLVRLRELSKGKGTRNRPEAEVGSKRARDQDSSSADPSPRHPKKGLLSCGVNSVEGVESFWDEEDFGLAWRKSRSLISPYDSGRFKSKSHHSLIESVATDCVRTLNVTTFLESQLQEYEDKLSEAEKKVKQLTEENADVKNSLQKEKESHKRLKQELDVERRTDAFFLQTEDGRCHTVTLERPAAKSAVDDFKKSAAFKELMMGRAVSVYDDAVKECQKLLRISGRVSEDIIQLINHPHDDDDGDGDDDDDDDEEEEGETREDDDDK
ncbi:hypothetical protein ACS0TY_027316 [Phlomoides rotata]